MAVYEDKQRGTWFFEIKYRDSTGRGRSIKRRGFKSEESANRAERKKLREMTKDDLPSSTKTIHTVAMEYINGKIHDIHQHTYRQFVQKLEDFIPDKKISSVTPYKALEWRNGLAKLVRKPKSKKKSEEEALNKPYSTRYKNDIIKQYKAIFNFALDQDYISKDPAKNLKPFPKEYDDYFKYAVVDAKTFFEKWNPLPEDTWINIYFKMFTLVAFASGARRGEIKGLFFKDYNGKSIKIYKSVPGGNKGDRFKIQKTKTPSSIREITLDSFTNQKLNEYVEYCKSKGMYSPERFLFGFNEPLPNNTIQDNFKRMGLGIRLHDLRHSHATILLEENVPVNVVSKRLGHVNVNTTLKTYAHVLENESEKALVAIESSIGSWGSRGDTVAIHSEKD